MGPEAPNEPSPKVWHEPARNTLTVEATLSWASVSCSYKYLVFKKPNHSLNMFPFSGKQRVLFSRRKVTPRE